MALLLLFQKKENGREEKEDERGQKRMKENARKRRQKDTHCSQLPHLLLDYSCSIFSILF